MNELVKVTEAGARASSRVVAEMFDKRHGDVLRSIDGLIEAEPELARNFAALVEVIDVGNSGKKEVRFFEMDRKGFSLLAMGFTGAKALEWKIRFIDAFDKLEQAVSLGLEPGGGILGTPDAMDRIKLALAVVREARIIYGRTGAKSLWRRLGLPDPGEHSRAKPYLLGIDDPQHPSVKQWRDARLREGPEGCRVKLSELHADYQGWCRERELTPVDLAMFGRELKKWGYETRHSNGMWLSGHKLAA